MSSSIQKLKIPADQVREAGSLDTTRSRVMISSRTIGGETLIDEDFRRRIPPIDVIEDSTKINNEREKTRAEKVTSRRQQRIDQIKVIGNDLDNSDQDDIEDPRKINNEREKTRAEKVTSRRQQRIDQIKDIGNDLDNSDQDDKENNDTTSVVIKPSKTKRGQKKKNADETGPKVKETNITIGSISSDDEGVITYHISNSSSKSEKKGTEHVKRRDRPPVNNQFLTKSIDAEVRETFNTIGADEETSKRDVEKLFRVRPDDKPTTNGNQLNAHMLTDNDFTLDYFQNMGSTVFLFQKAPERSMVRCTLTNDSSMFGRNEFQLFLDGVAKLMLSAKSSTGATSKINILGRTVDKQNAVSNNVETKLAQVEGKVTKKSFEIKRYSESGEKKTKMCDVDFNSSIMPSAPKSKDIQIRLYEQDTQATKSRVTYYDLVSKVPFYDKKTAIYKLDFKGRASKASIHNVQIIDASDENNILLQVGKVSTKRYILDFKEPFSLITAFGFAIALLIK